MGIKNKKEEHHHPEEDKEKQGVLCKEIKNDYMWVLLCRVVQWAES